ncbi:glycoside hydrolase family 76 protein, partial [Mycena olivaceomarginata]
LRDTDGLWFDGQNAACTGPDRHKWTYNQGPVISALGWMSALTGDDKYITFALITLDGVVNTTVLAESCDGAASSTCDGDQQYFKHLQYFLDNVDDTVKQKYASFVGKQAAAVIARTTSDGDISNVWFTAP